MAEPQEMFARLGELQQSFETRLANQKQVIENLDTARKAALDALAAWQEFGKYLADDYTGDHTVSTRASSLLNEQGVDHDRH